MRSSIRHLPLLLRLTFVACAPLATGAVVGCAQPDSVIKVEVTGEVSGILQMEVFVTVGGQESSMYVPAKPRPIALPTDFSIQIPRALSGAVVVTVRAKGAGRNEVGVGTATASAFFVGAATSLLKITLLPPGSLTPAAPTAPSDGGSPSADAGSDVDL